MVPFDFKLLLGFLRQIFNIIKYFAMNVAQLMKKIIEMHFIIIIYKLLEKFQRVLNHHFFKFGIGKISGTFSNT